MTKQPNSKFKFRNGNAYAYMQIGRQSLDAVLDKPSIKTITRSLPAEHLIGYRNPRAL